MQCMSSGPRRGERLPETMAEARQVPGCPAATMLGSAEVSARAAALAPAGESAPTRISKPSALSQQQDASEASSSRLWRWCLRPARSGFFLLLLCCAPVDLTG